MEHGAICNVNCGDKKTDEIFMYFVIEIVVENRFRDLIVEIHFSCFHFFSKFEMNVENDCLLFCFILFIFFAVIFIDRKLS